ncbi:MAG: DUF1631 family protein, partial [Burkholderiales bacterium]|nr:DUF1631 family protein [Burkholderiales bacterium]
ALVESGSGTDIQTLLGRLKRPLLELAQRDQSFLETADHPARQMVDLLEQYAIATDQDGRFVDAGLQRFLDRLVERIASRAGAEPRLFELAGSSLARMLVSLRRERRSRVAGLQQACEGRDRIRLARERVDEALASLLGGRQVPELLPRLLDAGWRQHLVLLEIRGGMGDADWQEAMSVLERLLQWLQPGYLPGADFRDESIALAGRVEVVLGAVDMDHSHLSAFLELLDLALGCVADGGEAHPQVLYPMPAGAGAAGSMPATGHETLHLGGWWLVEHDGRAQPMQLVWHSRRSGHCLLVNRAASGKLEITLDEFAQRGQAGLIKPWSDQELPLLERLEFSLLDESRQALQQRANQDPVSGLLNRKGFVRSLNRFARKPGASTGHLVGVLEFDQLRIIYNACGVDAAERLIRKLVHEVQDSLGAQAVLSSFRNDTLGFVLPDTAMQAGRRAVEALLEQLGDFRFHHGEQSYSLGLNIGLTHYEPATTDAEEAVRQADAACIASKAAGRNRVQVYEQSSVSLRSHESLADWAGRIDHLLEGSGLSLRAQMVMPIGADAAALPYYEILLGIQAGPDMPVSPMSFVPAVERLNRSQELDLWVMRHVLHWVADNRRVFDAIGGFAINVSALSLASPEVIGFLREQLARPEVPASKLIFEITETAAIGSYGVAQEFMQQIRRYGCRFSLDDFGSGYTSYAHLKNLRTDSLKIDGSFVKDMVDSPSDYAMVKSMHEVARSLGMRTVAEYVETPMILAKLREIGVDYAQGYAIHKPCPIEELAGQRVVNEPVSAVAG